MRSANGKSLYLISWTGKRFPLALFMWLCICNTLKRKHNPPSAVDSAFYGIKWAHDLSGIPFPTDDPIVEAVRSASQRVLGTRPLSRKGLISPTLIHEIVKKSDLENSVVLRNVTMTVLSFAIFFRFDDVSRIRRSDISFKEGFMVIKVLKSKNDQLRRGDEIVISNCPVLHAPLSCL